MASPFFRSVCLCSPARANQLFDSAGGDDARVGVGAEGTAAPEGAVVRALDAGRELGLAVEGRHQALLLILLILPNGGSNPTERPSLVASHRSLPLLQSMNQALVSAPDSLDTD